MWKHLCLCTLVAGSLAVGGCPDESTSGTVPSGGKPPAKKTVRLVLGTNSEPDTLNPLFAEMVVSTEIAFLGQRELTMFNARWELVPDLAERIPSLENGGVRLLPGPLGPDGAPTQKMEVTWAIKKDAVWEDGVPVTADDFIFAWQVQMDETQEIIDRDLPERVEKMEARGADKKTLVVTWKAPYAFFDQFQVHHCLPAHRLKKLYLLPTGKTADLKKHDYGRRPMSNGPFKFKEWVPGQYITYVKNPRYTPAASIDEITFRIIPNNNALESALLAGDIDGVTPAGGFTVSQIEELKSRNQGRFSTYAVPGLVWAHVDFNLDDSTLADVRVRHALAHAVNRQQLIDQLFYGKYTLAHTFLPPRHWGYKADLKTYPFDLEKAAALLDEAGWKQRGKGAIRTKRGRKLALSITAVSGIRDIEQLEQVIQSDLKSIGVDLRIDNKPAKVFFGEFARYRKIPHLAFYSWQMDPTSFGNTLWQEDMIPSKENAYKGQNFPAWRNAEVTKLLKEIPTMLKPEARREALFRVQEIWAEELPSLPMYFRPVVAVTRKDLQNYTPTGTQTPVTWNAHEWTIKAAPEDNTQTP